MKPRVIACVIFLVAVTIVSVFCHFISPKNYSRSAEWIAAANLPRNTLVDASHLRKPDFPTPAASWSLRDPNELIGKYTCLRVRKGERISPEMLTALPTVFTEANSTLIFFPAPDLGGATIQLNAGTQVHICGSNGTDDFGPYVVEAEFGRSQSATLLVRVANSEVSALKKLTKQQVRVTGLP